MESNTQCNCKLSALCVCVCSQVSTALYPCNAESASCHQGNGHLWKVSRQVPVPDPWVLQAECSALCWPWWRQCILGQRWAVTAVSVNMKWAVKAGPTLLRWAFIIFLIHCVEMCCFHLLVIDNIFYVSFCFCVSDCAESEITGCCFYFFYSSVTLSSCVLALHWQCLVLLH